LPPRLHGSTRRFFKSSNHEFQPPRSTR
jgi:hypothetical protein